MAKRQKKNENSKKNKKKVLPMVKPVSVKLLDLNNIIKIDPKNPATLHFSPNTLEKLVFLESKLKSTDNVKNARKSLIIDGSFLNVRSHIMYASKKDMSTESEVIRYDRLKDDLDDEIEDFDSSQNDITRAI
ncbi:unnamed protein product [Brachionus calyciflorus]|uniref:Uncharacterized protein n=1 Tax=Brachionus calyciflorus TaxID=104777 RepID=A0A813MZZ6_9BILA|nr:unnamed protein product [Brachionus calyciflorus]